MNGKCTWMKTVGLVAVALLMSACSGGGNSGGGTGVAPAPTPVPTPTPTPTPNPTPPPTPPPSNSGPTAPLDAVVIDADGRYLSGASLQSGTATVTTDSRGRATIPVALGQDSLVAVSKSGFAEQVRVVNLPLTSTGDSLLVSLIARSAAVDLPNIESGASARGAQGARVTFPPNALVDAGGQPARGTIQMSMTPVDPTNAIFEPAFPGRYDGIPTATGAVTPIVSYGATELVPTQNGQKLQLAAGQLAQIELPVFATRHRGGALIAPGQTIPLWSLDASTGLWKQEGQATLVRSADSPTGIVARAQISHFSWWNIDDLRDFNRSSAPPRSTEPGRLNVTPTISSSATVPANQRVRITARVIEGSGPQSAVFRNIPLNQVTQLIVPGDATVRVEAKSEFADQSCRIERNVPVAEGATVDVALTLLCTAVPRPRFVRPTSIIVTNSDRPQSYQIAVDGTNDPEEVRLLVDGQVVQTFLGPQFFYSGMLDTRSLSEGNHELTAQTLLQGATRTSPAIQLVIDRTPPQLIFASPDAGADVTRNTTFALQFNEAVVPLPFDISDAIVLSVLPLGASEPVRIPAQINYVTEFVDPTGTRRQGEIYLVRPNADLPIGTVSISWGGMRDGAGNSVAGVINNSWITQRAFTTTTEDIPLPANSVLPVATDGGSPLIMRQDPNSSQLQLLRISGNSTQAVGPAANERTLTESQFSMVQDQSGAAIVAFVQRNAANTGEEVVVRRFNATSAVWETLGSPWALVKTTAVQQQTPAAPALIVDAQDRPFLVFTDTATQTPSSWRYTNNAWASLGGFGSSPVQPYAAGRIVYRLALAPSGDVLALFAQSTVTFGTGRTATLARFNGSAWSTPLAVTPQLQLDTLPPLAVDASGAAWTAWGSSTTQPLNLVRISPAGVIEPQLVPSDLIVGAGVGSLGVAVLNGDPVIVGQRLVADPILFVARRRLGSWEPSSNFGWRGHVLELVAKPFGSDVLIAGYTQAGNQYFGQLWQFRFPAP